MILCLVLICIILLFSFKIKEQFYNAPGYKHGFAYVYDEKPECKYSNNCFKGSYVRSQASQNFCEPSTGLKRQKKSLTSDCLSS